MILFLHIVIAITSVLYATYVFFAPSKTTFRFSYGLIALTFISGIYLAVAEPAHLLQACASGLMYTAAVTFSTVAAHAKQSNQSN